jgi:ATP-binding cassette, subfamily C (CFTR/MRP), member 1
LAFEASLPRTFPAKVMLRDSEILILDKATSNVDMETDKRMQGIIRKEFKDNNVTTITNRVETISIPTWLLF